jgi:hypothetical protein
MMHNKLKLKLEQQHTMCSETVVIRLNGMFSDSTLIMLMICRGDMDSTTCSRQQLLPASLFAHLLSFLYMSRENCPALSCTGCCRYHGSTLPAAGAVYTTCKNTAVMTADQHQHPCLGSKYGSVAALGAVLCMYGMRHANKCCYAPGAAAAAAVGSKIAWSGLDWTGLDWTGLDWTGLDWTGLDWTGLDWTGLDWTGLDWTYVAATA